MKSLHLVTPLSLILLLVFSECKKETTEPEKMQTTELGENDPTIIIRTNKNQYFTNETINVSVTNKLDLPVNYFKCDNR